MSEAAVTRLFSTTAFFLELEDAFDLRVIRLHEAAHPGWEAFVEKVCASIFWRRAREDAARRLALDKWRTLALSHAISD